MYTAQTEIFAAQVLIALKEKKKKVTMTDEGYFSTFMSEKEEAAYGSDWKENFD